MGFVQAKVDPPSDPVGGGEIAITKTLPFKPKSLLVDNYTAYWLYIPNAFSYVPPYYVGVIKPLIHTETSTSEVQWLSPFVNPQAAPVGITSHFVEFGWTDAILPASAGGSLSVGISTSTPSNIVTLDPASIAAICACNTTVTLDPISITALCDCISASIGGGSPFGAASAQQVGLSYSGIPLLPHATTPGNVLLAVMFASGNTVNFPTAFRAKDNPRVSPASPEVPPFSPADTAAWTILATATTDYSGQNIGGPCGVGYQGPFHGGAGGCTSGLMVAAAWRHVAVGEVTTQPAQFSTERTNSQCLTYLWELPTTTPPDGTFVEADGTGGGNPSTATLPTISGNCFAAIQWATAAGHSACATPTGSAFLGAGSTYRGPVVTISGAGGATNMNDLTIGTSNQFQWGWMVNMPVGGIGSVRITGCGGGYNEVNWCGIAIRLPAGITLPDIPYPGNQSL